MGASADADEHTGRVCGWQAEEEEEERRNNWTGGSRLGMRGEREPGESERERERERVPSLPLFITAIDRGVCALIQVHHLLELDKRARAWALCCHSQSVH